MDSFVARFENRVVGPDRHTDVPFPEEMPHIEVEAFADDFEDQPLRLTELDELTERLVNHGRMVDELQQLFLASSDQRELTGHGLSRSDLPRTIELFDFPPLRGRKLVEDCFRHVYLSDCPIEIGKDGPLRWHDQPSVGRTECSRPFLPGIEEGALCFRQMIDSDPHAP